MLDPTVLKIVEFFGKRNPGAMSVLSKILKRDDLGQILYNLASMNMKGPSIWGGYKYFCKEDIDVFCQMVLELSPEMVYFIVQNGYDAQVLPHMDNLNEWWGIVNE